MATATIQRRRLGYALKRAREDARKTQDEAAEVIDAASSKISRLELGQSGVRLTDLNLLLDFYGVAKKQAEWMRDLARAGRQRGRWSGYRDVIPEWFRTYLDLETDATGIRWYQCEVMPGVLQTENFMRAIHATGRPRSADEEVDRQIMVRLERQAILAQQDKSLHFILSESVLRRNIGDTAIMRDQLTHLAKVAEQPNVDLQILPFDAQMYVVASFGFTILRFEDDAASDTVYLEDYTDATYLDSPRAVRAYSGLWSRLQAAAVGQVESRNLILRLADEKRA